jgi:hypothetical protein
MLAETKKVEERICEKTRAGVQRDGTTGRGCPMPSEVRIPSRTSLP